MDPFKDATSTTLIRQVAGGTDQSAESVFVKRYQVLAHRVARAMGIPVSDIEDVLQEAIHTAMTTLREQRYDRDKGGFRQWFKGIVRFKVMHARRNAARTPRPAASLPDVADPSPGPAAEFAEAFDAQWREAEIEQALDELRGEVENQTWQAFDMVVRQGAKAKDVAKTLGMTRGAVDQAVRRVRVRLAEKLGLDAGE
ncbi:MAG: sigma-70 family RNA polymerase sigma factor [Planctomycetes bacterium]|nr:sigma-70 family RNA polymerase sigma factor [Planctomycetota bacterium]